LKSDFHVVKALKLVKKMGKLCIYFFFFFLRLTQTVKKITFQNFKQRTSSPEPPHIATPR